MSLNIIFLKFAIFLNRKGTSTSHISLSQRVSNSSIIKLFNKIESIKENFLIQSQRSILKIQTDYQLRNADN
jgi:hypothetical protein